MQKLLINRSKWVRGRSKFPEFGVSRLKNDQDRMCCLGFWCKQFHNISEDNLLDRILPYNVNKRLDFGWHYLAVSINDKRDITEKKRELDLKELFLENGIKIRFSGRKEVE